MSQNEENLQNEENINEMIFNSVRNCMNNGDDVLVKICLGEATEEEKLQWQKEKGVSDEVTNVLKQYCDMGFNMASEIDSKIKVEKGEELEKDEYMDKINYLTAEIEKLKLRVEHLERNADKHVEELIQTYPNHL